MVRVTVMVRGMVLITVRVMYMIRVTGELR